MTTEMTYTDGDVDTNQTHTPTLNSIVAERYSRRQTLFGGVSATTMAVLGTSLLTACGDDGDKNGFANIGVDGAAQTSSAGRVVTLTAIVSDPDGVQSTAWTQTGGPTVTLTQGAVGSGTATFLAPAVAAATDLTFSLTATDNKGKTATVVKTVTIMPATLGFAAVAKNKLDVVTVPAGYTVQVVTRLGDPIAAGVPAYANNGSDTGFAQRIGDHGDALYWFGLSAAGAREDGNSTLGLVVQNHENINQQYLHPNGATTVGGARPEAEALKEIECHGVSVTEFAEGAGRKWAYVQASPFNRRLTPMTPMVFNGPVKSSELLKTAFSPTGTDGRGTINNCANGHTPWATAMTCEENWAGYFRRAAADVVGRSAKELTALARYGVTSATGNFGWSTVTPANAADTTFRRWDARVSGATAADDFRNEPNQFGWVLEFDPYDKAKAPRKRTALGRMGHEGCWPGKFVAGRKPAFYMGDDAVNEYLFKFVSNAGWVESDANVADRLAVGDKYLDAGTLYVARFNADGSGNWLPLVFGTAPLTAANAAYSFADQADVLTNARLAADALGATPMDRPEWTAVNPQTGEVYLTLTNNGNRVTGADTPSATQRRTDAANPRVYVDPPSASRGNRNGHIVRLREAGDNTEATTFTWDIYLFAAGSDLDPVNINVSGLTADNDMSSPDGLVFGRPSNASGGAKPLLWIETDDSAYTDATNCMLLAALPGTVGDGTTPTITNTSPAGTSTQATRLGAKPTAATLKRFLVGPIECEITGIDSTPDGRTVFVGIQHPGENGTPAAPTSHWPDSQATGTAGATVRPRSALIAITKDDGGVVGL